MTQAPDKKALSVKITVWTLRLLVGAVFIFSGFAKMVDPYGSMYKFAEYFALWHWAVPRQGVFVMASALAIFEFGLGVALALGCFRRASAWLLAVFMAVMTALTVYIYAADPVSDCGCFGDAFVLSNGATLLKNIVLDAAAVGLLLLGSRVGGIIVMKLQWLVAVASVAYGVVLAYLGYNVQPIVDFRPYSTGTDIAAARAEASDTDGMRFVYSRDGVEREFSADSIPDDDSWTFVRRIESKAALVSSDITINDADGDDVTTEVFAPEGKSLIMIVNEPQRAGLSRSRQARELAAAMDSADGQFVQIIAADYPGGIEAWRRMTHASGFDTYCAEDTELKMLARGDMALVYIVDGVVRWKYNLYSLPPDLGRRIMSDHSLPDNTPAVEQRYSLTAFTTVYLIVLAAIALSGHALTHIFRRRPQRTSRQDTPLNHT